MLLSSAESAKGTIMLVLYLSNPGKDEKHNGNHRQVGEVSQRHTETKCTMEGFFRLW